MLGKQQFAWLKDGIENSKADFIFVVSSVNFMVPHVGSGGGDDKQLTIKKDDAWTVFLREREELIEFWDGLDKGVFVLTGDLHNSFAIRITDNVWEFASGPHNSINHAPMKDEGGRPANGRFQYGPRACDIRWSSYAMEDIPRANRNLPALLRGAGQQRLQQPARARRRAVVRLPAPTGDLPVPRCVHR